MELTDREWKAFRIGDLFSSIKISKSADFGRLKSGNTAFVGRTGSNNGIQGFVSDNAVQEGGCITVGMVGTMRAFWHNHPFATSQNICILRDEHLNEQTALFLCLMIDRALEKYTYNHPVKLGTFPSEMIVLPVTNTGQPDYDFMEQYIKDSCLTLTFDNSKSSRFNR